MIINRYVRSNKYKNQEGLAENVIYGLVYVIVLFVMIFFVMPTKEQVVRVVKTDKAQQRMEAESWAKHYANRNNLKIVK